MRDVYVIVPLALSVIACGSSEPRTAPAPAQSAGSLTPPKLLDGYTRLIANTIPDIPPGTDITRCQYAMAPFDRDMDVMDVQGTQSEIGHHAVAFSYTPSAGDTVGAELKCMMDSTEFTAGSMSGSGAGAPSGGSAQGLTGGAFLGAVGPKGRGVTLPDGVAFRLKKGQGIMLNLHYINPTGAAHNGDAYIDLKFVEVDPNRPVAAMFVNINGQFKLAASTQTDSSIDCVAQSDVSLLMMSNHMHEYGTRATTEVLRGGTGAVEILRDDPSWSSDMVNNPTFAKWDTNSPFVLHAGDTIRTSCSWDNPTSDVINFPREMCISAGFALATGANPTAPACFNGSWVPAR